MHPRTRLLLVAACLSLAAPAVAAVWTNVGPGGGNVNIVTVDPVNPNNVYIVAALRAFKSTDAGLSWTPIEHPTGQLLLGEFVIDPSNPSTIYIPGAGSSVVKSTDGGATLTVHPMGIFPSGALAMDPTNPQHLWAAGYDTGKSAVAQSTDGGLTWTHVLMPGNVTSSLTVLAVDPLAPSTIYAGATGSVQGVYKSTDGGASFSLVLNGGEMQTLAVSPTTPGTVFAGNIDSFGAPFIKRSTDGGASWTNSGSGIFSAIGRRGIAIDRTNSLVMYAATLGNGVFKSTDGGASWSPPGTGLPGYPAAESVVIDPTSPSTLYVGTFAGVGKSTDAGATWNVSTQGLYADETRCVILDPTDPNVVYAGSNQLGVFKSTDGGDTWTPSSTGLASLTITQIIVDPGTPSTLYVNGGRVSKSTDGGASWSTANDGLDSAVTGFALATSNPSTLYAATYEGVFKTTDGAASWNVTNGSPFQTFNAVAADPTNDQVAWAASGLDVYKTTDGGDTWTPASALPSFFGGTVNALAVDPSAPSTLYGGVAGGLVSAIVRSTDGGATWAISKLNSNAVDFAFGGTPLTVFAATTGGVIATRNGANWSDLDTPEIPYLLPNGVGASATRLYAAIEFHSVWRRSIAPCTTAADCDDANQCTTDTCNPASPSADVLGCVHATVTCPAPGDCQAASCDPTAGCVTSSEPDGTQCTDDGTICTADTCVGGVCTHAPDVAAGCKTPTVAKAATLTFKGTDPAKAKLTWNWKKGQATTLVELGDPFTAGASDYTLCGFDRSGAGGSYALRFSLGAPAGGTCPTKPCWQNKLTKVKYKDKERTPDGVDTLLLVPGPDGAAKLGVVAKGPTLALPAGALVPDVKLQLRRDDAAGVCWEATFQGNVTVNTPGVFKAKSD